LFLIANQIDGRNWSVSINKIPQAYEGEIKAENIFACFYGFYFIESSKGTIHLVEILPKASSWFKVR
jgi:hypothetical protein